MLLDTNLRKPTDAELVWCWRRRQGLTLNKAAGQLGISPKLLWKMENGAAKVELPYHNLNSQIRFISDGERCAIARKRTQFFFRHKELAKRFGISHVTLIAWEREEDPRLIKAWKKEGFKF